MKPLEKDELFQHLHGFLKNKGVELKEGGYSQTIQKSCSLLSDAINAGQDGLSRAKVEVDKRLDQLRQVIHEKTAPRGSRLAQSASAAPPPRAASSSSRTSTSPKTAKTKRAAKKKAKGHKSN
jgi:hypothetical protein